MKSALCLVPLAFALAGCGGGSARPEGFAVALPPAPQVEPDRHRDGAIYQASHGYAPLYYGNRAARVGDIVTIALVERTQTSKSTSGSTKRDGSLGLSLPSWTGIDSSDLNASGGGSFKGAGDASQASSIRADLTVSIVEVRPNGTALVRGEKVMQLSQGEEWVQLSGWLISIRTTAFHRSAWQMPAFPIRVPDPCSALAAKAGCRASSA